MKWEIVWFMWYKADMCLMQKFTWPTKFGRNARDWLKNHLFRYMKTNNIVDFTEDVRRVWILLTFVHI